MESNSKTLKEKQAIYQNFSAEEVLQKASDDFPEVSFATSFGAEDQVILHMISELNLNINIFTLDTGRLPQETYDVMAASKTKYDFNLEVLFPATKAVETMVNTKGVNLFYNSISDRKECCKIRKIDQLLPKLAKAKAWISGLRKNQSVTRANIHKIDWDGGNQNYKILPLADWSASEIWEYIKKNDIPYNKLHDQNYPSIGCAPCTRAIKSGEDVRAGRWWWEEPEQKECGIHFIDGKIVRTKDLPNT